MHKPVDLRQAIRIAGLKNGDRISFHHHLRLGDRLVGEVLELCIEAGLKDLTICASSLMGESCTSVLRAVEHGCVSVIETTGLKEPLSSAMTEGRLPNPVIFRSHGGRAQAITSGRLKIDAAFIAVSAADYEGNVNGVDGPNRFGSVGYALVDAEYAKHVICVTDYLVEERLQHVSIAADKYDQLVQIDSIGDREKIVGGSLRKSSRPVEKLIAERAVDILDAAGAVRDGLAYQAGSGGISLLASNFIAERMRSREVAGTFASGGASSVLVSLLKEGLFKKLYDVQSFDDQSVLSLKENPDHIEMSASLYANPDFPGGCIADKLDVMILSATEADREFNVNSLTGFNGRVIGALGGAPDTAAGAGITIAVLPAIRGRIPTLRERVCTVCTPGKDVDVIVTERGVCINPLRPDLAAAAERARIHIVEPDSLIKFIHTITGVPKYPEPGSRIAGIVEYRDGSVLDKIYTL